MNKEEIINELSRISTPTGITPFGDYTLDDYTCDKILDYIDEQDIENTNLKQENKILKENAENNDKVVDKVNWDNRLLKQALSEIRKVITECKVLMPHEFDWDEQTDSILQIIDKYTKEDDKN